MGAVQLNVIEPSAACVTSMENAGKLADAVPSDAVIAMPSYIPSSPSNGWPLKRPVDVSKLAQRGFLRIEKVIVFPSASVADGVKSYVSPVMTAESGEPQISGGLFCELVVVFEDSSTVGACCSCRQPPMASDNVAMANTRYVLVVVKLKFPCFIGPRASRTP